MEGQSITEIESNNNEQQFDLCEALPILEQLIDLAFSEQIYLGTDRENTDNSATKSVIEGFEDPVPEDVLDSHADAFSEQNYFGERKTDNSHTESIIEDHEDPVPEDVLESHADLDVFRIVSETLEKLRETLAFEESSLPRRFHY